MPEFQRPSCALHYEDTGGAPTALLFPHGWCDASTAWADRVHMERPLEFQAALGRFLKDL